MLMTPSMLCKSDKPSIIIIIIINDTQFLPPTPTPTHPHWATIYGKQEGLGLAAQVGPG